DERFYGDVRWFCNRLHNKPTKRTRGAMLIDRLSSLKRRNGKRCPLFGFWREKDRQAKTRMIRPFVCNRLQTIDA
ncbi:hypothetical protein, partial [Bacillus velezensis]|uniref:hypothetical protein n=1 Tax=Bacillus velezensis TaxID=492670 RepID=UPI00195F072C